jgi:predicted ATPase
MTTRRIAVTGGPGAGKTTLWREIARVYAERVVAMPEVATLLLAHVFPAVLNHDERRALQCAIFHVQRNLEQVYESRLEPGQFLLCDRGLPDGAGYWPDGPEDFFASMQCDWQAELARYEAVVFMESAAVGGLTIASENLTRTEDLARAAQLDQRLRAVWTPHPSFRHVPHQADFAQKVAYGKAAVEAWLSGPAV